MDHSPNPNQLFTPNPSVLCDDTSKKIEDQPGSSHPEAKEDQEYGCKYCNKKFLNKQSLGGHQNAHKVERALEKAAREARDFPGLPFSNNNIPFYAQQHHGLRTIYNAHPGLTLAGNQHAVARPILGSGVPHFPGQSAFNAQNPSPNIRLPNIVAAGDGSLGSRPVHPNLAPVFAEEDKEYRCKYCTKKFLNKQALGGHQNAHKAERALEKAASQVHDKAYAFPLYAHQQHGLSMVYNGQPRLPLSGNIHHAAARPVLGSGVAQFLGQSSCNAQNPSPNILFPNIGAGDGSLSSRPAYLNHPVVADQRNKDGVNDQQDKDEAGLNLSLKL